REPPAARRPARDRLLAAAVRGFPRAEAPAAAARGGSCRPESRRTPPAPPGRSLRRRHGRNRRPRLRRARALPARDALLPVAQEDGAALLHRPRRPLRGSLGCRLPFLIV